ncbi:MAG: hypothetical protein U0168_00305 [Nannocystaceae bacterium]
MAQHEHDPALVPIDDFVGTRDHPTPRDRLRAVVRAAQGLRERLLSAAPLRFYRSFDLVRVPYPTKYGLRDACSSPLPFIHILNRLFVIQVDTPHGLRTILGEPLDRLGNAATPFFAGLARPLGGAQGWLPRRVWPALGEVSAILASLGIAREQVDYITYDHLHTQDLRGWLGTPGREAFFPRAKLLVMRREWDSAQGLLPTQAQWYCPDGTLGVPRDRVVLLDRDVMIGEGLALVPTPGHTEGNHSIVARTDEGIFVTSENGVAPECYAPRHSALPGVAKWARRTGAEVVLNGNTLEGSVDQYISMMQEATLAGPSRRNPDFPNVAPSSELSRHPLSPGLSPTFHLGELAFGSPVARAGS